MRLNMHPLRQKVNDRSFAFLRYRGNNKTVFQFTQHGGIFDEITSCIGVVIFCNDILRAVGQAKGTLGEFGSEFQYRELELVNIALVNRGRETPN